MLRVLPILALAACGAIDTSALEPGETLPIAAPRAVFLRSTGDACPRAGAAEDMRPEPGDRLVVAELALVSECSGAGGDWIVGRPVGGTGALMMGAHACYFLGRPEDSTPTPAIGVARVRQTAALFHGPEGWCIRDLEGREPVVSDEVTVSVALFDSREEAERAAASWGAASPPEVSRSNGP